MKAKITRSVSFQTLLKYIFRAKQKGAGAENIGGSIQGDNINELAQIMRAVSSRRPDIMKPVWHCSLALPEGERLDSQKWATVATDFVKRMAEAEGIDHESLLYKVVRHTDTAKDHVHICLNRVALDGKVFLGQHQVLKAIRITQELELDYGLTITAGLKKPTRTRESDKARRRRESTGEVAADEQLKDAITAVIVQAKADIADGVVVDYYNFCGRLNDCGIRVIPQIQNKDGAPQLAGLVYQCLDDQGEPHSAKASALGSMFTWSKLAKAGVTFDPADEQTASVVVWQLLQADNKTTDRMETVWIPKTEVPEAMEVEPVEPVEPVVQIESVASATPASDGGRSGNKRSRSRP